MDDGQVNLGLTVTGAEAMTDALQQAKDGVVALGKANDELSANLRAQQSAIDKTTAAQREANMAEEDAKVRKRGTLDENEKLNRSLEDTFFRLEAQKKALQDPVFVKSLIEQKALREEINKMTADVTGETAAKEAAAAAAAEHAAALAAEAAAAKAAAKAQLEEYEATHLNARSKRELIVEMRRLMSGDITGSASTAMVLGETQQGITGSLKAAVAMLGGPYVVAAGAAALATVGVTAVLWKASEAAENNYHALQLQGEELGVSADAMLGFQNLAVGTNISTEELTRAFGMFEKRIGANSEKFRELGITARDPLAAFEQIMDKVHGMSDAEERAAFVSEALGRGGEKLIPILMEGGDAAKRAIEAMKIPEDVKSDFDKTISDQIEIDKNWMVIKQHSGEAFAGIRAGWKGFELDIMQFFAGEGGTKFDRMIDVLDQSHGKSGNLSGSMDSSGYVGNMIAQIQEGAGAGHTSMESGMSFAAAQNSGSGPMSEEQKKALEEAQKALGKDSLAIAIQNIKDEWKGRLEEFAVGSDNYKTVLRAELQAEDDIRKSFAKKGRTHSKEDRTPGEADSQFEKATGISYGAYSMAHPGGTEADTAGQGASVTKGEQDQEAKAQAKMMADLTKSQEEKSRLEQREVDQFAKWEAEKTRIAQEEAKRRQEAQQKYFDAAQKGMEQQILLMEQGKFSAKELDTVFENMAEQAVARLISETVVSLAQSVIMGTAWAGPAMLASIATSGGADAAGSAGYEAAMMQAQFSGGHAKGGFGFGGSYPVGEVGPEMANPVTPVQYTPASLTNNYQSGGNSIVVHIHGGDLNAIQRTIRNATTNGAQSSR